MSEMKVVFLKEFLIKYNIDICFLQETHIDKVSEIEKIKEVFYDYSCVFPKCDGKSRGVGILIKKNENISLLSDFCDFENRVVGCEVSLKGVPINLINIYAPTNKTEQNEFIEALYDVLNSKKRVILAGDFNCVENEMTDRANCHRFEKNAIMKNWLNFFKNYNLKEIKWLDNQEKSKIMTWSNGIQSSRIDRIYTKSDFPMKIEYSDNLNTGVSDHRMVVASMSVECMSKKSKNSHWKLNESVLNNKRVDNKIKNQCGKIPELIKLYGALWYDIFNEKITKLLKFESRSLHKQSKKEINDLFERLLQLDESDESDERKREEKIKIKIDIEAFYRKKKEGNEKRVNDARMSFVKQPTKVLIEKEIQRNRNCELNEYECVNKTRTTELDKIIEDVHRFYNNLLGEDKVQDSKIDEYNFRMEPLKDDNDRDLLNAKITYDEAYECIKRMSAAAPGAKGLTIGFFKKYFPYFGKY